MERYAIKEEAKGGSYIHLAVADPQDLELVSGLACVQTVIPADYAGYSMVIRNPLYSYAAFVSAIKFALDTDNLLAQLGGDESTSNTSETDKRGWYWVDTRKLEEHAPNTLDPQFHWDLQMGQFVYVEGAMDNDPSMANIKTSRFTIGVMPFDCLVPVKDVE